MSGWGSGDLWKEGMGSGAGRLQFLETRGNYVEWMLDAENPPPLGSEAHPQTPDCVCKFVSFAACSCLVPAAACARLVPATTCVWQPLCRFSSAADWAEVWGGQWGPVPVSPTV